MVDFEFCKEIGKALITSSTVTCRCAPSPLLGLFNAWLVAGFEGVLGIQVIVAWLSIDVLDLHANCNLSSLQHLCARSS